MKKLKLYLDTTIWSFPFADDAPDKQKETKEFFDRVRWGIYKVYLSEVVTREIEDAPNEKKEPIRRLIEEIAPQPLEENEEVKRLADLYLERGVLPKGSRADAMHIAYATLYEMDALVSWNFRHLANLSKREKVRAVNTEQGYRFPLEMVTPLEVYSDERK